MVTNSPGFQSSDRVPYAGDPGKDPRAFTSIPRYPRLYYSITMPGQVAESTLH
jgi:hypothetical protein